MITKSCAPRTVAALLAGLCLTLTSARAQSDNINLESNYDPSGFDYADIWGYAAGGVELAILMDNNGTYFVDVTDPTNPIEVGFIDGVNSIWRDAKTFDQYCYIVNEDGGGLQIVSLLDPLNPTLVGNVTTQFSTAHNVWIDEAEGLLFAVGCDNPNSETNVYDLEGDIIGGASPTNPGFVYNFSSYYVHDMYSQDGVAYLAAVYDGLLVTADLTSLPGSMPVLGTITTDDAFTHNVWTTTDGAYAFTTDETATGHVTIVDVSDPTNMQRVGEYVHPDDPNSIIHNVAVVGNLLTVAWYRAGLEVIDVTSPTSPQRLGYYDTSPASGSGFDGAWGVYPFAPSGAIYISDIQTGLYVFTVGNAFGFADGTVTDQSSTLPIESVTVSANGDEVGTTNGSGFYHLVLAPGSYSVDFENFYYEPANQMINVSGASTTITDVQLVPKASGSLAGTVSNANTLVAIDGAEVSVPNSPLAAVTSGGGGYSFDPVPVGSYSLSADAFGYAPASVGFTVNEAQLTTADVALIPAEVADDIETDQGWTVGAAGDQASTGIWERVDPIGTSGQPEDDHTPAPGVNCWITGQHSPGQGAGFNDVDGGRTTLLSPVYDLSGLSDATIEFYRWYTTNEGGTEDVFIVDVTFDGNTWINAQTLQENRGAWERVLITLSDLGITPTSQIQLRFIAGDEGQPSLVEAGVDDLEIYGTSTVAVDPSVSLGITRLLPVSPNPFRSDALVSFELASRMDVSLNVFDVQGRLVQRLANGTLEAGPQSVRWDGRTISNVFAAPGVYYVRFESPAVTSTQKIVRTR